MKDLALLFFRSLHHLIDILFPRSEEYLFLESVSIESLAIRQKPDNQTAFHAAFSYKDPLIREMIWALKYGGSKKCGHLLGKAASDNLLELISDDVIFGGRDKIWLVPIPISKEKLDKRGYNQSLVVADAIVETYPDVFELQSNVLKKIRVTKNQSRTDTRKERLLNLKDSFVVKNHVPKKKIVIIDDVFTTGATFNEAISAFRKIGVKNIECFAIAH